MTLQIWGPKRIVAEGFSDDLRQPQAATLTDGRVVVVWEDDTGGDIMMRVYNADGTPASDEEEVLNAGGDEHADVIADDSGGWVVALSSGSSVIVRGFGADGTHNGFHEVIFGGSLHQYPELFRVGDEFWVTNAPSGSNNVMQFYKSNANMTALGASGTVIQSNTTGEQAEPDGAQLVNGSVVIAWREGSTIEFRIFDDTGGSAAVDQVVTTGPINSTSTDGFGKPGVTALENGAFLITWVDNTSVFPGSGWDVWGRIYNPGGVAYTDPFLVNGAVQGFQLNPEIVALEGGGFVAFYHSFPSGTTQSYSLKAQKYDSLGNKIGNEVTIISDNVAIEPQNIGATLMQDGRIFVTWNEIDSGSSANPKVVSQIIDPRGGNVAGTTGDDMLYGSRGDDDITSGIGEDLIYALDGNDYVDAGVDDDKVYGGLGNDQIFGDAGRDTLIGSYGDDFLDGGSSSDLMEGGNGNDTYVVESLFDTVIETGGLEDIDTIISSIGSTTLVGIAVENLTLTRFLSDGTGNSLDNEIIGSEGNNDLSGGGGNDTLRGNEGHDDLFGGQGDDLLEGGDGIDDLDGGTGADTMRGGDGDDTYVVDNPGDVIEESSSEGTDTVFTALNDFTLAAHVENLTMQGAAVTGTGNGWENEINGNGVGNVIDGGSGADTINGNGGSDALRGSSGSDEINGGYGNDFIDGGSDADIMKGSNGNDIYVVDNAGDVIDETGGVADVDTVRAFVSFNLSGEPLEKLELRGAAAINGTGNSLNNEIKGNDAVNALDGGGGKDLLTGMGGADVFLFSSVANIGNTNATRDVILDFSQAESDVISLAAIDAIAGGGDDAFTFIGGAAFSGTAGELRAVTEGPNTRVEGDIFGNSAGDFQIALLGNFALTGGDFLL